MIDLLIYKTIMFSKKHMCLQINKILNFFQTRFEFLYNQNVLIKHKQYCELHDITFIKTSDIPHMYWKNQFQKFDVIFQNFADFRLIMKSIFSMKKIRQLKIRNNILYVMVNIWFLIRMLFYKAVILSRL